MSGIWEMFCYLSRSISNNAVQSGIGNILTQKEFINMWSTATHSWVWVMSQVAIIWGVFLLDLSTWQNQWCCTVRLWINRDNFLSQRKTFHGFWFINKMETILLSIKSIHFYVVFRIFHIFFFMLKIQHRNETHSTLAL